MGGITSLPRAKIKTGPPLSEAKIRKFTLSTIKTQIVYTSQQQKTNGDRIAELLRILQMRGNGAFDNFLESLDESNHKHVADGLREEMESLRERERYLYILLMIDLEEGC